MYIQMAKAVVILFLVVLFILLISRLDEMMTYVTSPYKTTDQTWMLVQPSRY